MTNKEKSETTWENKDGICKVTVEVEGELDREDILAQCEYTIKGLGFGDTE